MEYFDRTIPAYGFYVPCRPTYNSPKGKEEYQKAIADAARKEIERPIEADDIEVEILYVTTEPEKSLDVDNVGKPTLDALNGIAYLDDHQVRAIRIVRFDKTKPHHISGRIGPIRAIYGSSDPHNVWIWIYSFTRSKELNFRRPKGWEMHVLLKPVGKDWD